MNGSAVWLLRSYTVAERAVTSGLELSLHKSALRSAVNTRARGRTSGITDLCVVSQADSLGYSTVTEAY